MSDVNEQAEQADTLEMALDALGGVGQEEDAGQRVDPIVVGPLGAVATHQDAGPGPTLLSRDGRHEIPYSELEKARQEVAMARAENERLQRELAERAVEAPTQEEDAWAKERAELEASAAALDEQEDREVAQAVRAAIKVGDANQAILAQLGLVNGRLAERERAEQKRQQDAENAEVEAALANAPLLTAWANDAGTGKDGWHRAALSVNEELLNGQGEAADRYRALSWKDRFTALPGIVEQRMGMVSQHRAAIKPIAGRVPTSMSAIPGGQPPKDQIATGIKGLDDLGGGLDAIKFGLSKIDRGGVFAAGSILGDLPIGAINTPGSRLNQGR